MGLDLYDFNYVILLLQMTTNVKYVNYYLDVVPT